MRIVVCKVEYIKLGLGLQNNMKSGQSTRVYCSTRRKYWRKFEYLIEINTDSITYLLSNGSTSLQEPQRILLRSSREVPDVDIDAFSRIILKQH